MIQLYQTLDLRPIGIPQTLRLSQYDSDFEIIFELTNFDGAWILDTNTTAEVQGTKTDGHGYSADAVFDDQLKTVTIAGDVQMTAAAGRNVFEVVLFHDGDRLGSKNFVLDVERAALDAETTASDSKIKNFTEMTEAATQAAETATAAAEEASAVVPTLTAAQNGLMDAMQAGADVSVIVDGQLAYGAVTASGIGTQKYEAHTIVLDIGDYDYIDFKLLDTTYKFAIYLYNNSSYTSWISYFPRGSFRVTDKSKHYLLRIAWMDNSHTEMDLAAVAQAIQIVRGKYSNLVSADTLRDAIQGGDDVIVRKGNTFFQGAISSSGYSGSSYNATSGGASIEDFDQITFVPVNPLYKYAVYSIAENGTIAPVSGGYITEPFTVTDKSLLYALRISWASGSTAFTDETFAAAAASVDTRYIIKSNKNYGYDRCYRDITHTLTFERKAISADGIEDSTTSLLAKIPADGNFEARLNAPIGKFSVWKKAGSTITRLQDWTYYQYRYTGDYTSEYYVAVAAPDDSTFMLDNYKAVQVLQYADEGEIKPTKESIYGKNIAVFGDSIVQGRYVKNATSGVNMTAPKPWAYLLAEAAGTEPHDFGIGGALVYNNDWKSLSRNYGNVSGFDVVFICAGTNDFGGGIPIADFRAAYTEILTALVESNTKVIVCTPTRRSTDSTNSTTGLKLQAYATAEIEIAEGLDVDVIDVYTLTNNAAWKAQLSDGLHPNEIGQKMLADIVLAHI